MVELGVQLQSLGSRTTFNHNAFWSPRICYFPALKTMIHGHKWKNFKSLLIITLDWGFFERLRLELFWSCFCLISGCKSGQWKGEGPPALVIGKERLFFSLVLIKQHKLVHRESRWEVADQNRDLWGRIPPADFLVPKSKFPSALLTTA